MAKLMYKQDILLKIRPLFEAYLKKSGYVLVDLRFFQDSQHQLVLEALADRAEGGITLDECMRLNRELGSLAENSGELQERYLLDISSPGIDRPLTTPADFRRYIGRQARFFLKEPLEGKIEYCARIVSVDEKQVEINIGKKTIQIQLDKINKAKQVIP